jgi:hypothetical protein
VEELDDDCFSHTRVFSRGNSGLDEVWFDLHLEMA